MNDPGLDEPAQQAAEDVERNVYQPAKEAEEEEQAFLDPRCVLKQNHLQEIYFNVSRVAGGSRQQHARLLQVLSALLRTLSAYARLWRNGENIFHLVRMRATGLPCRTRNGEEYCIGQREPGLKRVGLLQSIRFRSYSRLQQTWPCC